VVLELELRAFTLSHSTSPFLKILFIYFCVMGILEKGSHELFAQADLEP
jgi:hypothetical protein